MDKKKLKIFAIISSAGEGKRAGFGVPKQFYKIDGSPLYLISSLMFIENKKFEKVIIVLPPQYVEREREKFKGNVKKVYFVEGGKTRMESVWNGLREINEDNAVVLVHDGVRPFVSKNLIDRVIDGVTKYGSAIPVIEVFETLKILKSNGFIKETIGRENVRIAQTPQGFLLSILKECYIKARERGISTTDDASLLELSGYDVYCVEGEKQNFKITVFDDLLYANYILRR